MNAARDVLPIGAHVAAALTVRAAGGDPTLLAATIRALCSDRDQGHVCLPLAERTGRTTDDPAVAFPDLAPWRAALQASGLCADGSEDAPRAPLVLDAQNRLYLRRDFVAERTIVAALRQRVAAPERVPAAVAREHLQALGWLGASLATPDWQVAAILAAVRGSFLLLTGGPGTGKTTTVARLLAVLDRLEPGLRIALAAPTGKAAARLHEALREHAAREPAFVPLAARCRPTTLHRLLGYLPADDSFRARHASLAADVVVVDEASMADPALLAVLCDALPASARLVLVGDHDQLAAVAAGQVLGDVCRAAAPERGVGQALAAYAHGATGVALPVAAAAAPVADCVVRLHHNHRSGEQPGIGGFAGALARRDAAAALATLRAGHRDLALAPDPAAALRAVAEAVLAAARGAPEATAARLRSLRILTATRHGLAGSLAWNERVEGLLAEHGVRVQDPWYVGRPVLVTTNDHQHHVYNGDLGIVVPGPGGRPVVAFPRGDGTLRLVPPVRLPAHETAWAMTVHKAQGSEFDTVLLAMPDQPGPWWQAPLLYTGVTRARQRAIVVADEALLAPALGNWPTRSSGLADALLTR